MKTAVHKTMTVRLVLWTIVKSQPDNCMMDANTKRNMPFTQYTPMHSILTTVIHTTNKKSKPLRYSYSVNRLLRSAIAVSCAYYLNMDLPGLWWTVSGCTDGVLRRVNEKIVSENLHTEYGLAGAILYQDILHCDTLLKSVSLGVSNIQSVTNCVF